MKDPRPSWRRNAVSRDARIMSLRISIWLLTRSNALSKVTSGGAFAGAFSGWLSMYIPTTFTLIKVLIQAIYELNLPFSGDLGDLMDIKG